jgi:hypothetical protein
LVFLFLIVCFSVFTLNYKDETIERKVPEVKNIFHQNAFRFLLNQSNPEKATHTLGIVQCHLSLS